MAMQAGAVRHGATSAGTDRRRRLALTSAVALAHAAMIAALVIARPDFPPDSVMPPVFDVLMMRAPPPGDGVEEDRAGGGAPAAASRVHPVPAPPPDPVELIAPPIPTPVPELAIGPAIVPSVAPASGHGGEGSGKGQGTGAGDGPGSGSGRGAGPVLISGPRGAVMTANVSGASLAALPGPYAVLQCYIRVGRDRLEDCRVKHEHPAGSGVGAAALRKSEEFRYRAPTRVGRSRDRYRQTIAVGFPAPPTDPADVAGGRH